MNAICSPVPPNGIEFTDPLSKTLNSISMTIASLVSWWANMILRAADYRLMGDPRWGAIMQRWKYTQALLALAVALLFTGCGASAPENVAALNAPLAKSTARVKLVRPSEFAAALSDARVKIDNNEVAILGNGDSKTLDLPAGRHTIVVDHWSHPNVFTLELEAKPGRLYVLEVTPRGEAVVAGALFGVVGSLVEAAANENGGSYQIRASGRKCES
jgi:hypothetical protein